VEETLSTLLYATRTKNIHNRPTVQYDPKEAQISLLRREIELLRQENGLLREQLRGGGGGAAHGGSPLRAGSPAPAAGGSPGGSGGKLAPSPRPPAVATGLDDLAAADEMVSDLRASSSPQLAAGRGSLLGEPQPGGPMRTSLGELGANQLPAVLGSEWCRPFCA
jgi:hypothetical protein